MKLKIIAIMLDWNTIDTVLLDMDGTLLDLHFDNYFWLTHLPSRYAQEHNTSLKEANDFISHHVSKYIGTLNWYCLDHWSELVRLDIPALKKEISHKIKIRPFAEDFLKALKSQGKKLVLITNSHPKGLEIKLDVTQIDQHLDIVISSHDLKAAKEDAVFWQRFSEIEPFDPNRTVFIDDTPRVLRSAQAFGIKYLVCITQPDSQKQPVNSNEFIDICHFDEILPPEPH